MTDQSSDSKKFFKQLEDFFDTYLHKKSPVHFPPKVKEFIVAFAPWITLIIILLALPGLLFAFGLTSPYSRYAMAYGLRFTTTEIIWAVIALISLIMEAAAIPGLFAKSLKSWHLVYYAVLVSAVGQLLSGQIVGMIVGLVLFMYILFQIKEYYK